MPVAAQAHPFPTGCVERNIATNGTTIHVRIGARIGVVLLHDYGETGDMWAPLAGGQI